jgi:hypothetical protein
MVSFAELEPVAKLGLQFNPKSALRTGHLVGLSLLIPVQIQTFSI